MIKEANSLPRVTSAWAEGFGGVLDQKFVGNGIALDQENLIEGSTIYIDIGARILPPILDPLEAKSGNTCNNYPRLGQDCDRPHAVKEGPKYIAPLSLDPKKAESLAEIEVAATPNANAHKQPWYEYPRQICNPLLLHFEDAVDIFQCATMVHHWGCRNNCCWY